MYSLVDYSLRTPLQVSVNTWWRRGSSVSWPERRPACQHQSYWAGEWGRCRASQWAPHGRWTRTGPVHRGTHWTPCRGGHETFLWRSLTLSSLQRAFTVTTSQLDWQGCATLHTLTLRCSESDLLMFKCVIVPILAAACQKFPAQIGNTNQVQSGTTPWIGCSIFKWSHVQSLHVSTVQICLLVFRSSCFQRGSLNIDKLMVQHRY